jgi:hypothetical protein
MSTIQDMRETWRPRLAHSVVWMVRVSVPLGFATMIARPEVGASVVALVGWSTGWPRPCLEFANGARMRG